jgi:CheY-like chemotaxis protein
MADSDPHRLRVLIVEDEALIAMMLEDMLDELGHSVAGVEATIDGAIAAARASAFDCVLLDANLGGDSAAPVASALRDAGVPFVVTSGYERADLRRLGFSENALRKPYRREELAKALATMMPAAG